MQRWCQLHGLLVLDTGIRCTYMNKSIIRRGTYLVRSIYHLRILFYLAVISANFLDESVSPIRKHKWFRQTANTNTHRKRIIESTADSQRCIVRKPRIKCFIYSTRQSHLDSLQFDKRFGGSTENHQKQMHEVQNRSVVAGVRWFRHQLHDSNKFEYFDRGHGSAEEIQQ